MKVNNYFHKISLPYQGVRNVSFSENFAHVLNEWLLTLLYCETKSQLRQSKKNRKRFFLRVWINLRNSNISFPPSNFCFSLFFGLCTVEQISYHKKLWTASLRKASKLKSSANSTCSPDIKKSKAKFTLYNWVSL